MPSPPSHVGYNIVEPMLAVAWCHCRVMLVIVLALPSRCWSWRDIAVESCWWWRCRDDNGHGAVEPTLAVAWQHCRVMLVMVMSSYAGDGTAEVTLAMAWRRCRVLLEMALLRWRWSWRCRSDDGRSVTLLSRHAGDGVVSLLSLASDGAVESY
jgi:hypothetical protein